MGAYPEGRLLPLSVISQASDFLRAARREVEEGQTSFCLLEYFLVARALELALKAFLLTRGYAEPDVVRIRHDLEACLREARDVGLGEVFEPTEAQLSALRRINPYYVSKDLEYLTTGRKDFPDVDALLRCASSLIDAIRPEAKAA